MHAHMHALHVCKNSPHALNCSNTEYSPQAKYCGSQHDHPAGIKLKDRAECIAHRAAAHPQVKVWHFFSLHRPSPKFHLSHHPPASSSPAHMCPHAGGHRVPPWSYLVLPPGDDLSSVRNSLQSRDPHVPLYHPCSLLHTGFMFHMYILLRNALQTSLTVQKTHLPWEMPCGWAALAAE